MLKELLYFSNLPPLFILVIMEDMLRAGSSSRSEVSNSVLILVLMEDTLRAREYAEQHDLSIVLILVLMEDNLRELFHGVIRKMKRSLNPCSNGRYSQRSPLEVYGRLSSCLNPCFNGRYSQSFFNY